MCFLDDFKLNMDNIILIYKKYINIFFPDLQFNISKILFTIKDIKPNKIHKYIINKIKNN